MTGATYCLGAFAVELRQADPMTWGQIVKAQPIDCPMGCGGPGCYAVCREYAAMQWRISKKLKEPAR